MKFLNTRKLPHSLQYLISVALVILVSSTCFLGIDMIGYRVVALILLMTVSVIAMLFEFLPVFISAILSAIIWNFFFIPPLFTFHIYNAEDVLMFLLYFIIALVNATLTTKIREAENKARDKEDKENTIKLYNTLLNSLSHELRTPISTILAAVDTLKDDKVKLSSDHQTQLLTEIDIASIRLNRQVENLLNMSRLESGTLQPNKNWCDINDLILSVIPKLSISSGCFIEFQPNDDLPQFKLDTGLMEQIIHNLLHNAILYTPDNSSINIKALYQSSMCVIVVSDNGKGFPEQEIPFVFDKFYRLPGSKTGGSGLGLSIVKGFVEAQNGRVILQNNPTGGATFTVEIPSETSYVNFLKNE